MKCTIDFCIAEAEPMRSQCKVHRMYPLLHPDELTDDDLERLQQLATSDELPCTHCGGTGECDQCNDGYVERECEYCTHTHRCECDECDGTGDCQTCKGAGIAPAQDPPPSADEWRWTEDYRRRMEVQRRRLNGSAIAGSK